MPRAYQSPSSGSHCGPQCAQMPNLASRNHCGHWYCLSESHVGWNLPAATGSAEVLTEALQKLSNEKVKVRVILAGVGAVNESDVLLASASNAVIIGFNVRPEKAASMLAEREKVDIRLHTVIYNLTDEIKAAMSGLLEPVFREVYKGKAEVRETFRISKVGNVAGCLVQEGTIPSRSEVRLLRDNVVVHTGKIGSLRRFKDDVSEVKSGMECGITLENYGDIKAGDVMEAYKTERVANEAA